MRAILGAASALLLVAVSQGAQEPHRLTEPGLSPIVEGVLELPRGAGPHPGVILLPGSGGWRGDYPALARALADEGFASLALHYEAETGPAPAGSDPRREAWPRWQAAVRQAAGWLQRSPAVSGRRLGLVGFSRGAFLAVSVASSIPAVGAVVDVCGGGGMGTASLAQEVQALPPLLILHGEADRAVPVGQARRLHDAVRARGGEVEMHIYPGAGHAFTAPGSPDYAEAAAADAWKRMMEFLRRTLADPPSTAPAAFRPQTSTPDFRLGLSTRTLDSDSRLLTLDSDSRLGLSTRTLDSDSRLLTLDS